MNNLLRRLLDLPPQASTFAYGVDLLHYFVIGTTMLGATFVFALAVLFLVQGRAGAAIDGRPPRPVSTTGSTELAIIGGLLALFIGFWVVGAIQYNDIMTPPPDAIPVFVTAKQWMWKFAYPDGRTSIDVLTVPVGRPIKLVMTSRDVIHSFYVPAFRMKHDVVPGRYYAAWFEAITPGTFDIRCAEYCGISHSGMLGQVRVLSADDYRRWQESATSGESHDLAREGLRVAAQRGCLSCHTIDGQPHIGPSFAGLYGSDVKLQGGRTTVADDGYLTRSMMEPQADVVAGFQPVMPSYRGLLEEPEVAALVELIASLQDRPNPPTVALPRLVSASSAPPSGTAAQVDAGELHP